MKIAYVIPESLNSHPGLKYKVEQQASFWKDSGHQVYLVYLALGYVEIFGGERVREEKMPGYRRFGMLATFANLSWSYGFARRVLADIRPNITYTRYLFPARHIHTISEFSGSLICEINSDDRKEFTSNSSFSGRYNAWFRKAFLKQVDGFVFMTDELRNSKSFSKFHGLACTIPNGANVDDFPFLERTANLHPNLVFVGSPGQSWHGLDKIYWLAKYLGSCKFHIVGPTRQECESVWSDLPENVAFHGYLSAEKTAEVVAGADVGIGTLALHRKGMSEACPLKVRQYLAQGVPVIAGYKDPDIQQCCSFYFQISNHEGNVQESFDDIINFIDRVHGNGAIRREARKFAEEYLSFTAKEERRLSFFERVLSS